MFDQSQAMCLLEVGLNILSLTISGLDALRLLTALDDEAARAWFLIYKTAKGQDIAARSRGL